VRYWLYAGRVRESWALRSPVCRKLLYIVTPLDTPSGLKCVRSTRRIKAGTLARCMHCFIECCALSKHPESFYNTFILIHLRPSPIITHRRIVSRAHELQPQLGRRGTRRMHASDLWQHSTCGVDKTINRARLRPKSVTGAPIRLAGGFLRPRSVRSGS
jgi:hypothetical protein